MAVAKSYHDRMIGSVLDQAPRPIESPTPAERAWLRGHTVVAAGKTQQQTPGRDGQVGLLENVVAGSGIDRIFTISLVAGFWTSGSQLAGGISVLTDPGAGVHIILANVIDFLDRVVAGAVVDTISRTIWSRTGFGSPPVVLSLKEIRCIPVIYSIGTVTENSISINSSVITPQNINAAIVIANGRARDDELDGTSTSTGSLDTRFGIIIYIAVSQGEMRGCGVG